MIVAGLEYSQGESWGPVEVPDSFVVADNKVGGGSGEAKLYIGGRDNAKLRGHFGPQFFSASCVMFREDLLSFLEAAKAEYDSPSQDFVDASLLSSLWMERWEKVSELPEQIFFEILEQAAGGDHRCYVKGDGAYDLLRELPLSRSATVTFTKLTSDEGVDLQLIRLHVKHQNQKIRFWQVQHDATGIAAESLGLLWSPKKTKTGSNSKWYTNMAEVQPGDRIYSYRNGKIQALGIAETIAVSGISPFSDDEIDKEEEEGWLLKTKFISMPTPFSPTENYGFLSSVMSNIDSNSVRAPGANAIIGYLKEISPGLAAAYDVLGGLNDGSFIAGNEENLERFRELADDLLLPASFLSEIHDLLEDKKQVIFYGPPGAGKTYVAMKLAEALSESSEVLNSVELVQFHPSYAYEDFVEGFRPTEEGSFTLKKGKLLSLALRAKQNPDKRFFLIIDEINRGNVAKVFGEMYFLLEYRDQSIQLQYSDESFQMPNNLYFIGTMNSADRSIGLIDSALRRRFHFVSFYPTEMEMKGLLRNWLKRNAPDVVWVADAVDEINSKIDRNFAIGPSHFMKSNLNDVLARKIWKRSILPYIEDVFFNQQSKVDEFKLENLRTLKRLEIDKAAVENEVDEDDSAAEAS